MKLISLVIFLSGIGSGIGSFCALAQVPVQPPMPIGPCITFPPVHVHKGPCVVPCTDAVNCPVDTRPSLDDQIQGHEQDARTVARALRQDPQSFAALYLQRCRIHKIDPITYFKMMIAVNKFDLNEETAIAVLAREKKARSVLAELLPNLSRQEIKVIDLELRSDYEAIVKR